MHRNTGKGAAVTVGMLNASCDWLLFVDADASADVMQVFTILQCIQARQGIEDDDIGRRREHNVHYDEHSDLHSHEHTDVESYEHSNVHSHMDNHSQSYEHKDAKAQKHSSVQSHKNNCFQCHKQGLVHSDEHSLINHNASSKTPNANDLVVCGSRRMLGKRSFFRKIPSLIFNALLRLGLGIPDLRDSQCGFKLFSRKAAHRLFRSLHLRRWAFDLELFWLMRHLQIPWTWHEVNWCDVKGSKVRVLRDGMRMVMDLAKTRLYYSLGIWINS